MNFINRSSLGLSSLVAALSFQIPSANAEVGVTATEIVVGSTGSLTGSTGKYGGGLADGLRLYFDEVNAKGGIRGRKIRYISLDDDYKPPVGLTNIQQLVEKEKIFAITGGNGTGTVKAWMPYAVRNDIPVFFPVTGTEILREPQLTNTFNLRVSFADEAALVTNYTLKKLAIKDIAVFHQDDPFGESGRNGVQKALFKHGLSIKAVGKYKNTDAENVDAAVDAIMASGAKAVYMQAVTTAAFAFIRKSRAKGYNPIFMTNSVVGTADMAETFGKEADGIISSEVIPLPSETKYPIVKRFLAAAKAAKMQNPHNINLEGYVCGAWFARALELVKGELTRASLKQAVESMQNEDLGGIKVGFDKSNRQALQQAFVFELKKGTVVPVSL